MDMFAPFTINKVEFKNRILRSSIGGRTCTYSSYVTDVWENFEMRFAAGNVAAIISATFHIEPERQAPFEYPSIAHDGFVRPLARRLQTIKKTGCRYIIQVGDPGYQVQTALFPHGRQHDISSSSGFDLMFGISNRRAAMSEEEIEETIERFGKAAERCRLAGADGIEITAEKGYIIHQFLNPGWNRRTDKWGGSTENRFRLLKEVIAAIRRRVGDDFIIGVRLAAVDFNAYPIMNFIFRFPWVWPWRHHYVGNGLEETLEYGKQLERLGVNYLHIVSGGVFINPKGQPGDFPYEEIRMVCNSTRHLSRKAAARAALLNMTPAVIGRPLYGFDWRYKEGINLEYADLFKRATNIPIIVNGGIQSRDFVAGALRDGKCDAVSMARALLANPNLVRLFQAGDQPARPCTYCNRCAARTVTSPLGCYEPKRFSSLHEMEESIMGWNMPALEPIEAAQAAE